VKNGDTVFLSHRDCQGCVFMVFSKGFTCFKFKNFAETSIFCNFHLADISELRISTSSHIQFLFAAVPDFNSGTPVRSILSHVFWV